MEMSITRALSELTLLTKRIEKHDNEALFATVGKKGVEKNGYKSKEDFGKSVQAQEQARAALVQRRDQIKAAVVASNAATKVIIGGKEMTVAAAIERKKTIEADKDALELRVSQYMKASTLVDKSNERKREEITMRLAPEGLQAVSKDVLPEIEKIIEANIKAELSEVWTMPNAEEYLRQMRTDLDTFESEVNFVLTESNTLTKIQIND